MDIATPRVIQRKISKGDLTRMCSPMPDGDIADWHFPIPINELGYGPVDEDEAVEVVCNCGKEHCEQIDWEIAENGC